MAQLGIFTLHCSYRIHGVRDQTWVCAKLQKMTTLLSTKPEVDRIVVLSCAYAHLVQKKTANLSRLVPVRYLFAFVLYSEKCVNFGHLKILSHFTKNYAKHSNQKTPSQYLYTGWFKSHAQCSEVYISTTTSDNEVKFCMQTMWSTGRTMVWSADQWSLNS
jgi:hypothetical protein